MGATLVIKIIFNACVCPPVRKDNPLLSFSGQTMVDLFYTTSISANLAHYELFCPKIGKDGTNKRWTPLNMYAGPRGYTTFFILNSAEHEIYPAHKC